MDERYRPTEFDEAVGKLEDYNDGKHRETNVPEQRVATGGFRKLRRAGALAVTVAVGFFGAKALGNQMTAHSSVRNYNSRLYQPPPPPAPTGVPEAPPPPPMPAPVGEAAPNDQGNGPSAEHHDNAAGDIVKPADTGPPSPPGPADAGTAAGYHPDEVMAGPMSPAHKSGPRPPSAPPPPPAPEVAPASK